jgi:hypothetical protein
MTVFERLQKRLKQDYNIDAVNFHRTYAGINMKSQGAFVWEARLIEYPLTVIGSQWSAKELLKSKKIIIQGESQYDGGGDYAVYPDDKES